jgi:hypothetical protein
MFWSSCRISLSRRIRSCWLAVPSSLRSTRSHSANHCSKLFSVIATLGYSSNRSSAIPLHLCQTGQNRLTHDWYKRCPSQNGRWTNMVTSLDIFKISGGGVLWRDAVATLETAKARIRQFALSSPGEYFILDQKTGQRTFVTPLGSQSEYPNVESRKSNR